jgi:hypothetical protein
MMIRWRVGQAEGPQNDFALLRQGLSPHLRLERLEALADDSRP